jgi:hypothetical protein
MGVRIFSNTEGAVFYCSTTDWAFGPLMPGENVAEAFLKTLTRDARLYKDHQLKSAWNDFNATKMVCPYDHREADVDTYGNETIFTCMAKGCKAQWNLAGEVVSEDEEEDDDLTEAERLGEARVMR